MRASSIIQIGEDGRIRISRLGGLIIESCFWTPLLLARFAPADLADWIRLGM